METNDELQTPPSSDEAGDDLRFAPPAEEVPSDLAPIEKVEPDVQPEEETLLGNDLSIDNSLDIDAALAAVATLDDLLAEQEATEQNRIAQEHAEAEARAERQARLKNPERFFPMPPMLTLQRGRIDSVVPALALILIGIWLTFTATTSGTTPSPALVLGTALAGLTLTLLVRWFSSGRWARGSLFFALVVVLLGGVSVVLIVGQIFATGWPLLIVAFGAAFIVSSFLAQPADRQLAMPGIVIGFGGIIGLAVTNGVVPSNILTTAASLWPVAAVVMAAILLLPLIFRRRN
jgi:hypothetical protein